MTSRIDSIGTRLREARKSKGLTQELLGKAVGADKTYIQTIENGSSLWPTWIIDLAVVLDVNPAWLQFGEPWAEKERPGTSTGQAGDPNLSPRERPPDKPTPDGKQVDPDFRAWLKLADQMGRHAPKEQVAKTARLLALNLAHYQINYGDLPIENVEDLLRTHSVDQTTARLVSLGMDNLVGILHLLSRQHENTDETLQ
jgi:transcriptional regulator with XRE-family HTH domain